MEYKIQNAQKPLGNSRWLIRWSEGSPLSIVVGVGLLIILALLSAVNPALSVVAVLVLLLAIVLIPRPLWIVYGLTFILPLVGGLSRGALIPALRLGQALLVLGFVLFFVGKPSSLGKWRLTIIDLTFVLFFLTEAVFPILAIYYNGGSINFTNSNNVYSQSPLQTLLGPIQYYLLYRIVVATISSEKQIKVVLELTFLSSILVSIIGIAERFIPFVRTFIQIYYPPIVQSPTVSLTDLRITSTLGHFSGLAAYLVFTIVLVLACYTVGQQLNISLWLLAFTTLFDSIALVLTGTFAGWIGLAVGVIAVFILIRRIPGIFFFVLGGVVVAALIFQSFLSTRLNAELGAGNAHGLIPQSLAYRIMLWQTLFLPAIGRHLWFGAGPAPTVLDYWSSEDSQYLYLLLRGGIPYFVSYFVLIWAGMKVCWQQMKRKNRDAIYPVALAMLVILIVLNVMNVTGEYFTYVGGTQTLWTLLALVVANKQFKTLRVPQLLKPH